MSTECIQEPRYIATCDRCPSKCQSWDTSRIKAEKIAVQDYGWEMRGMEILCSRCAKLDPVSTNSLSELRRAKGITQDKLSLETGISQSTLSRIESRGCDNVDMAIVAKLAKFFAVPLDTFLKPVIVQPGYEHIEAWEPNK